MTVDDMKTGAMNLNYYEAKRAKTLTPEQQKVIASMKKSFPAKLEAGKWDALLVTIKNDSVRVSIDGNEIAAVSSAGFAHQTKRIPLLSVPKSAVVDDVRIWTQGNESFRS